MFQFEESVNGKTCLLKRAAVDHVPNELYPNFKVVKILFSFYHNEIIYMNSRRAVSIDQVCFSKIIGLALIFKVDIIHWLILLYALINWLLTRVTCIISLIIFCNSTIEELLIKDWRTLFLLVAIGTSGGICPGLQKSGGRIPSLVCLVAYTLCTFLFISQCINCQTLRFCSENLIVQIGDKKTRDNSFFYTTPL